MKSITGTLALDKKQLLALRLNKKKLLPTFLHTSSRAREELRVREALASSCPHFCLASLIFSTTCRNILIFF